MPVSGTHDLLLAMLSAAIAVAASYTSLDLAGRVRAATGHARSAWLLTAALAMGGGIWSMHFVAMLAFRVPGLSLSYEPATTVISLLIAVTVTGAAFHVAGRRGSGTGAIALSGLFMGLGIAGMHYLGMAATRMPADLGYDPAWVAASVAVAVCASTAALWLAFRRGEPRFRAAAALVMGAAVAGMHHAGMRGATFICYPPDSAGVAAGMDAVRLALSVSVITFVILLLASVAAMFDRRFAGLAAREAEALRLSEERFRSSYRETPLPLHTVDAQGRIEQVSEAWLELLGYGLDEVVGQRLSAFMEGTHARRIEDWQRLHRDGVLRDAECRFVTKSGEVLDVLLSARARRCEGGAFVGAMGGLVDVTAQRRAEQALRQSQKMEAVGQLTGGVAHDFNNLLAVILGNLEMLRKRLPDDARMARQVDGATQAAQRGAALTQRMLAFARRQDLRPETVDVACLVHGMADLLAKATGPGAAVEVRLPIDLPPVKVDANQFELALLNLAVNARDAMPDGGTIAISATSERVASPRGPLPPGDYVRVAVTDAGAGMDEATLGRAREPFFTTKGTGKGTGLGLSMVHGLAEQSGGRLEIASSVGEGTTAAVWLPASVARALPRVERAAPVPAQRAARPLLVLVVDDDPLVRQNTAEMVEDLGHRAVQAGSGAEALAALRGRDDLEAVVTDHVMPGMTGLELVGLVRAEMPGMPVVLASGYAEIGESAPPDLPRIAKPFAQGALAEALAAACRRKASNVVPLRAMAL